MRILVDATPLLLRSAGVKNFVYYWLLHLKAEGLGHSVSAFPSLGELGRLDHVQSTLGPLATLARLLFINFTNIRGNRALDVLLDGRYDVFHASQHMANPPRKSKLTATIYDMTCWLMPEMHTAANISATKRYAERILRRADGLMAVSECSRNDAVRILGLREESIHVIHPGVSRAFFDATKPDRECVRQTYGIRKPYLLFVGCVEPRKNLEKAMDAWDMLAPSVRRDFELVVAGPLGWNSDRIAARWLRPDTGIRYLGYIPTKYLPALMAGASVFLYPSYYEGFGFPVLEAMAAGTPVITSNVSSLPEITGDAALLVNPRCAAEIADAVRQVLCSPGLGQQMRAAGIRRAEQYQWGECARKSLEFFRKVVDA